MFIKIFNMTRRIKKYFSINIKTRKKQIVTKNKKIKFLSGINCL